MSTISELTNRLIRPTGKDRKEQKTDILLHPLATGNNGARHATYEIEVFNFLLHNKDALGIQGVIRFTNLLVDGQVILSDGRRLVIEVKMRMNWLKACQAEWQFRQFLKREKEAKINPVDGAIVVFEEFSGDWKRKAKKAKNVWGWEAWYLYYRDAVDSKPMDLLMLTYGELQGYPL